MQFEIKKFNNGIEIIDSYKVLWDKETINKIHKNGQCYVHTLTNEDMAETVIEWQRSKFSLYLEWFIHTLCYKLHIQRDRAKNVFFEFNNKWFKNLWK